MSRLESLLGTFTNLFPLWVLVAGVAGFLYPPSVTWMSGSLITIGLAVIMLGMGLSLQAADFRRVFEQPRRVFVGVALQYTVMPLAGYSFAVLFELPDEFAAGLILVACCPGGTASNVISFLARADLCLSVTMTAVSTLLAALLTPTLTLLLVGDRLEVNPLGLFLDTATVVLLPVFAGLLLNHYLTSTAQVLKPFAPPVAVIAIALIVGSVLGAKREAVIESGLQLAAAIVVFHLCGFVLGYVLGRLVAGDEPAARTIGIEVGMQNSGLGVDLARKNFAGTLADVPGAISAMTHCILGSFAAALWRSGGEETNSEARGTEIES